MSGRGAHSEPLPAGQLHAGSTCPSCQRSLQADDVIVSCESCASLHHEECWLHMGRCGSYHCDGRLRAERTLAQPDVVVTAAELARVEIVPTGQARGGSARSQAEARKAAAARPPRLSRLAIASVGLATGHLAGVWGMLVDVPWAIGLGCIMGVFSLIFGVLALVAIRGDGRLHGSLAAGGAVLLSAAMTVVYIVRMDRKPLSDVGSLELRMSERMPEESELARMPAGKARALRANVVVMAESGRGFSTQLSEGSGIVTRIEGRRAYIVTNAHVVEGAADGAINVLFYNGERSAAQVAWRAPSGVDIVVLSCEALTLEVPEALEVAASLLASGERTFAVGNPISLYWSYTEGVISSIRHQQLEGRDVTLYQTQTPINRGNSGGGLYDMEGRLVGVNTWTRDKATAEGLSFAIASTSILDLMDDEEELRFLR